MFDFTCFNPVTSYLDHSIFAGNIFDLAIHTVFTYISGVVYDLIGKWMGAVHSGGCLLVPEIAWSDSCPTDADFTGNPLPAQVPILIEYINPVVINRFAERHCRFAGQIACGFITRCPDRSFRRTVQIV
ncbi:hypothetical protein D3C74_351190 [compost metagenome]